MNGTPLFRRVVVVDHYEYVRVAPDGEAAAIQPLVVAPRAASIASSHRTDARTTGAIRTPLGVTSRFSSPI